MLRPSFTATLSAFFFCFFLVIGIAECKDVPQVRCSKQCVAENCNSIGIKYGKYCGVGWSGCPGEKPCDDLDACCQVHDDCVEKKGMTNVKCHEKFKRCIKKVQRSGKTAFLEIVPMILLCLQWNRVWTWPFYLASLVILSLNFDSSKCNCCRLEYSCIIVIFCVIQLQ